MNRRPIYHEKSNAYRIVSVANGRWQMQEHVGRRDTDDKRLVSGWRSMRRPTDFATAKGQLAVRGAV